MKLSEFITGIGRVLAYYPNLKQVTGSTTASILLCQLIYWSDKTKDNYGWIYKDSMELEEETGLSKYEQTTARKVLIDLKILEEEYKRLDHKIAFRVNFNRINDLWEKAQKGEDDVEGSETTLTADDYFKSFRDPKLHADHPANRKNTQKKGDLVDGVIAYSKSAGMEKENIMNDIRNKIENFLHINTDSERWNGFIDFAYIRQTKHSEPIERWIKWAIKNNFNSIYWTPERCKTTYPQAFIEDTRNKPREDFVEKLPETKEEEYAPMPEEAKTKKKLY